MHDLELNKNCIPKSQAMFTVFTQIPLSLTTYVTIFKHESGCVFFFKGSKNILQGCSCIQEHPLFFPVPCSLISRQDFRECNIANTLLLFIYCINIVLPTLKYLIYWKNSPKSHPGKHPKNTLMKCSDLELKAYKRDTWIYTVSCASEVTHEINFLCQPTVKTYKDSLISF